VITFTSVSQPLMNALPSLMCQPVSFSSAADMSICSAAFNESLIAGSISALGDIAVS
jgi:hypothetical protein